jgi:hypothetical protein
MSGVNVTVPVGWGPEDDCSGRTSALRVRVKRPADRGVAPSRWTVAFVDDCTRDSTCGGEVAIVAATPTTVTA